MAHPLSIESGDTRQRALDALRGGGVVVLPTDTLYGFHAVISALEAVERIRDLKGGGERRFVLLADSVDTVERYVASFGCAARDDLAARWPAPLTVVLPAGDACPRWVGTTVAVRVPHTEWLRDLIARAGEPIVSTSVNRAGEAPMDDAEEIARSFDVDLVVSAKGRANASASTIVDLCGKAPLVLRRGDYEWAATAGGANPSK